MKKLVLETTAPFQGLPELVAYDEGLFTKEGLAIEWVDREAGVEKKVEADVTTPKGVTPFASHGKLLEQGKADMYNACEWGNYCRYRPGQPAARPPRHRRLFGNRGAAGFAGLYAAAARQPYRRRAVLFRQPLPRAAFAGRIPAARHDQIVPSAERLAVSPQRHDEGRNRSDHAVRAACHAEKKGCRVICSAFYHGTEVASDRVDAETYAAFNRAVREAVRRINADKKAYMHYFIDYYAAKDPEIAALKVEDLRESRLVVCDPAPIPLDEMQRTYDWLKSWGMLEETASPLQLINMQVQAHAHEAAD